MDSPREYIPILIVILTEKKLIDSKRLRRINYKEKETNN
jgi:hypothetical protein